MNGGTVIENVGKWGLWSVLALGVVAGVLAVAVDPGWWWAELVLVPLVLLGVWDLVQTRHSILRNFPILGHFRFLIEGVGSEMHQYLVESNTDGRPFNRDTRSLIYQRAKKAADKKPFGTELDVYENGYTYLSVATSVTGAAFGSPPYVYLKGNDVYDSRGGNVAPSNRS